MNLCLSAGNLRLGQSSFLPVKSNLLNWVLRNLNYPGKDSLIYQKRDERSNSQKPFFLSTLFF
jgi:hypothetical protein